MLEQFLSKQSMLLRHCFIFADFFIHYCTLFLIFTFCTNAVPNYTSSSQGSILAITTDERTPDTIHLSTNPTSTTFDATRDPNFIKDLTAPIVMTPNLNELATNGQFVNSNPFTVAWVAADGTGSPIDFYTFE